MGYMRHNAIIVSSWSKTVLTEAHEKAVEIMGDLTTPIVKARVNGYSSFMIAPDGSKEGWSESDLGDKQRNEFIEFLRSNAHDDGSNSLSWVEVQFADENFITKVTNTNDPGITVGQSSDQDYLIRY